MNVSIGLRGAARELQLELSLTEDALFEQVRDATGQHGVLRLTDTKGEQVFIPAEAIAYVQVAAPKTQHVGFSVA